MINIVAQGSTQPRLVRYTSRARRGLPACWRGLREARRRKIIVIFCFCLQPLASSLQLPIDADTITLKNKKIIQGKILPRGGPQVQIRTSQGVMTLSRREIEGVAYEGAPTAPDHEAKTLYRQRSIEIASDDIYGRYDLAQFALSFGLYDEAAKEFRALIPYFTGQTGELAKIIHDCEEAAFKSQLAEAKWWGQVAGQETKALNMIESLKIRYPDFAERGDLKNTVFELQKEMESRFYRQKIKKDQVYWVTRNFKIFASTLIQSQNLAHLCEELRKIIYEMVGDLEPPNWDMPVEVFILDNPTDYLLASGAEDWSGGTTHIIFQLDSNSIPIIEEQAIIAWGPDAALLTQVLAHEISHVVFYELLGVDAKIPPWVSEGFASYVLSSKKRHSHPSREVIPRETLARILDYPPFERIFYEQSEELVKELIDQGGIQKFLACAYLLGTGVSLEEALIQVYKGQYEEIKKLAEELRVKSEERS